MIYTHQLPTSIDLSESFADFLQYDTVENLKRASSLMGCRFKGQPRKAQIAKGIATYVKAHPLEVLQECHADTLMYIKKMIEMGKGSCITMEQPQARGHQIQDMELVLTYVDEYNNHTEFYLLDELHDIFSPHIDEAYKHPSQILEADMMKGLEDLKALAEGCKTQEEFLAKFKEKYPEFDLGEEDADDEGDETLEEIDALLEEAGNTPSKGCGTEHLPYSFGEPMMADIRDLHYMGQAAVCKAFHQIIKKGDKIVPSRFIDRFEEDYALILFSDITNMIDNIHFCVNDMDNVIYEIDMNDPMTFFDIAERLHRVIRLSQKKWPIVKNL